MLNNMRYHLHYNPIRLLSSLTKGPASTCGIFETVREFDLCGGSCTVVTFPRGDILSTLCVDNARTEAGITLEEYHIASQRQTALASNNFLAGRAALRRSILRMESHLTVPSILPNRHGAPILPLDVKGSISHKDGLAVGLALSNFSGTVGVDIEQFASSSGSTLPISRILTMHERNNIGELNEFSAREEVLLRFSLKEALFKAVHPVVERFIGMRDVEIDPHNDGTAVIRFTSHNTAPVCVDGSWKVVELDANYSFKYDAQWIKLCDKNIITAVRMTRV